MGEVNFDTPKRKVVIELKVTMIIEAYGNDEAVEFWLTESHCLGNEVMQLAEEHEAVKGTCFICHRAEVKYIREATEEDIKRLIPESMREK